RLSHDINDASVALRLHGRQHGSYHGEKAEDLVAQLPLQSITGRAFDRATQVRAGIVDEDVDPPKFLHDRVDKFLDSILVDDIGRHAEHGALFRQFGDGSVKLSGVATANCNDAAFFEQHLRDRLTDPA